MVCWSPSPCLTIFLSVLSKKWVSPWSHRFSLFVKCFWHPALIFAFEINRYERYFFYLLKHPKIYTCSWSYIQPTLWKKRPAILLNCSCSQPLLPSHLSTLTFYIEPGSMLLIFFQLVSTHYKLVDQLPQDFFLDMKCYKIIIF